MIRSFCIYQTHDTTILKNLFHAPKGYQWFNGKDLFHNSQPFKDHNGGVLKDQILAKWEECDEPPDIASQKDVTEQWTLPINSACL